MKKIKDYFVRIMNIICKPEMKILPGTIAYFLFLSIVPIITLIVYLGLIFSFGTDSISVMVNKIFPADISALLTPYVTDKGIDFSTIVFMISGFIIASNGPHSLIVTSNTLYKFEHASYLKRRIKALFMTVLLIFLFVFTILFLAFSNKIYYFIISIEFFAKFDHIIYIIYLMLKWPFAFIVIFIIIKILYSWAPDTRVPSKYMNRGTLFTTCLWFIITMGYSFYINHRTNYNVIYGSLSNIVVIMAWVYALSYVFVIGMGINNEQYLLNKDLVNTKENSEEKETKE